MSTKQNLDNLSSSEILYLLAESLLLELDENAQIKYEDNKNPSYFSFVTHSRTFVISVGEAT